MRLLPQKIGSNFSLRKDLVASIGNMTRVPDEQVLDIKARVAAGTRMVLRLKDLASNLGVEVFMGAVRRCVDDGRVQVRRRLKEFNDGTYRSTVFIDGLGGDMGLQRIHCAITKKDDRLTVNLAGTSPQNPFSFNAYAGMPVTTLANPCFSSLLSDVPPSVGLLDQIKMKIPDGTCLSASADAAVSCSLWPTFLLQAEAHCCTMKMAFDSDHKDKLSATQSANPVGGYSVGVNQHGLLAADLYVDPVNGNGGDPRPDSDGINVFAGIWGNYIDTNDAEELELRGPYYKLYSRITLDGHGSADFVGVPAKTRPTLLTKYPTHFPTELWALVPSSPQPPGSSAVTQVPQHPALTSFALTLKSPCNRMNGTRPFQTVTCFKPPMRR
jgi:N-methylhydantoinase B/oxoprolinase/acetone carboxylase alpha subunit